MLFGPVHLYAIVHALRNAKMYNKSFSQRVPLGLCEGQVFEGRHDSLSGVQTIMRLILVDLKSEPLELNLMGFRRVFEGSEGKVCCYVGLCIHTAC